MSQPTIRDRIETDDWRRRPRASLKDRLFKKVAKTATCWLWTGAADQRGYGRIGRGAAGAGTVAPHRAAYELLRGPIPNGLELDHLCRNPRCVNPDHLEPVTHRENLARGTGFSAVNAAKDVCPSGHPYSGDNLLVLPRRHGGMVRLCRACKKAHDRKRYLSKKAQQCR